MSLDSRVAGLPYESSSFATPAVRLVNQKEGPFMGRLRAYFDQLAHPMQDVHSGTITRAYCRAIYEESVSRCFILPPLAGEVRRSRIGGGERSEPVSRIVFMSYDTESKSRNADFILIAQRAIPSPSAPQALSPLERKRTQPFYTTRGVSRAPFYNLRRSRHRNPRPERPSNLRTLRPQAGQS